jgi:hypothetical protein
MWNDQYNEEAIDMMDLIEEQRRGVKRRAEEAAVREVVEDRSLENTYGREYLQDQGFKMMRLGYRPDGQDYHIDKGIHTKIMHKRAQLKREREERELKRHSAHGGRSDRAAKKSRSDALNNYGEDQPATGPLSNLTTAEERQLDLWMKRDVTMRHNLAQILDHPQTLDSLIPMDHWNTKETIAARAKEKGRKKRPIRPYKPQPNAAVADLSTREQQDMVDIMERAAFRRYGQHRENNNP